MHNAAYLTNTLILLTTAVAVVGIFHRLKLSPVLGYLVAGALIGPYGAGFIQNIEGTSLIASYGVVFLLFMIGLELSFDRLKAMRLSKFGFGILQVLITGTAIGLTASEFGLSFEASVIVGGALALSSTAIVLQVMADEHEQFSQAGRMSLAMLIIQDFAVVPLLVLVPVFTGEENSAAFSILGALLKAILAMGIILLGGRLLLRPLLRFIAQLRNAELFTATTLLVVLGAAWMTESMGLSMALGAFLAGLMVAETEFRHQVEADVLPYRSLLLGLFFMTVGMSLDLHVVLAHLLPLLGLVAGLMTIKALVIFLLCRLSGFGQGASLHTGLLLSQAGEFAFVLFGVAAGKNLISDEVGQLLLTLITVSMALTPLADLLGRRLERNLERARSHNLEDINVENQDLDHHAIVIGFGRMGKMVARILEEEGVHYTALDLDPHTVTEGKAQGLPIHYGDSGRAEVLKALGVGRAKAVIVTISDPRLTERAVRVVRREAPDVPLIARARDREHAKRLEKLGATVAIRETFEASLQVGSNLLAILGTPEREIKRVIDRVRVAQGGLSQFDKPTIRETRI